ncbi:MAG: hypothetical protein II362_08415, partial [Alistipes sp.]|nr:hypothetical protein [Alistipes sp.]
DSRSMRSLSSLMLMSSDIVMQINVILLFFRFVLIIAVLAAFGVVFCFHPPPKSPSRGGLDCRPADGVGFPFVRNGIGNRLLGGRLRQGLGRFAPIGCADDRGLPLLTQCLRGIFPLRQFVILNAVKNLY